MKKEEGPPVIWTIITIKISSKATSWIAVHGTIAISISPSLKIETVRFP